jgi:hypothetical protein
VAGNPPWVRWGYLPQEYRSDIKFLWRYYALFTQKGLESLMGTAELDLSILFTYACVDNYVADGAKLGFLITQEVVRSKSAGEGFRSFLIAPSKTPLEVIAFHDLVALHPFEAANKTGFIIIRKGAETVYPVPYVEWKKKQGSVISADNTLSEIKTKTTQSIKQAAPLSTRASPWQVVSKSSAGTLAKLDGQSSFKGRCGVSVDPYGVFLCRVLAVQPSKSLMVTNDPSLGDTPVPQMPPSRIEDQNVFPVVRGRDIQKWKAVPVYAAIITNTSTKRDDIPSEEQFKKSHPNTFDYLFAMREWALGREKFWQFFSRKHLSVKSLSAAEVKSLGNYVRSAGRAENGHYIYEVADGPFYSLFNVGPYSFAPYKVAWPMGASRMRAAVLTEFSFEVQGGKTTSRCVIPATGTTSYVSFDDEDEANYLCAVLNSSLVDAYISSFSSAGRGFGAPSVVSKFNIPDYDKGSALHRALSDLSKKCHAAAFRNDADVVMTLEAEIDERASKLWSISNDELKAIQGVFKEAKRERRRSVRQEDR